jgi:trehalose 6-phosphate synthase/phosphatase
MDTVLTQTNTHTPKNQLAQPPPEIVASLEALCDDPNNLVFVISGRRKDDLQARFHSCLTSLHCVVRERRGK